MNISAAELRTILTNHRKWLADPATGRRADFRGVNLRGVNLLGVDLRDAVFSYADLRGADLRDGKFAGADFEETSLSESTGLLWSQFGPIGTDRRTVNGIWQPWGESDSPLVVLHAGCFSGPRAEWDQIIAASVGNPAASPWEWPDDPDELDRLAAECTAAADAIQASIHAQLAAL